MNDYLGHGSGDRLLVTIADRIRTSIRTNDFAARLGGDEFVFIVDKAKAKWRFLPLPIESSTSSPNRSPSLDKRSPTREYRHRHGRTGEQSELDLSAGPTWQCTRKAVVATRPCL